MTNEPSAWQRKVAERRARQKEQQEADAAPVVGLEDFTSERPAEYDSDPLIQHVKNLPANVAIHFITEKEPKPRNFDRRDGIKFRCPHSDHTDNDPSAWVSPQKGLWSCGACGNGGDWVELAAARFGYRTSTGWRDRKGDWIKFRDELSLLFNWKDPEPEPIEVPLQHSGTESDRSEGENSNSVASEPRSSTLSTVLKTPVSTIDCSFDWRALFSEESFLGNYMRVVTVDDVPEEFHFASSLIALGMAMGRTVTLQDGPPVFGNLYICLIGPSGSGKSKASTYLREVLAGALKYEKNDPMNQGAKVISNPGSGEVLYEHFSRAIMDPIDPKKLAFYAEVRGLVLYSELAGLTGRAARTGATLKSSLIDLYDCPPDFSISSRTHGETHGELPFGSMLTSTQPGAIAKLVSSDDDKAGFLNRFIYLTGTEKERMARNKLSIDMSRTIELLRFVHRWGDATFGTGGEIQWTPEADTIWERFYHTTIRPDQKNAANDMLGRIDLLMKKLILLFTANKMEESVSATTVREALSLYQYFVESYGFTSLQISRSLRLQEEDDVLSALDRTVKKTADKKGLTALEVSDWPTARDVQMAMSPKPTAKEVKTILDALVQVGEIQEHSFKPKIGRPSVRYGRNQS